MKLYFTKTPRIFKKIFPSYIWSFTTQQKNIYLTFDDGPTPEITTFVLDELKKYQAKATFFCIGKNIKKNPQIFNQIIAEGHSVGTHTNNHLNGWKTNTQEYLKNIQKTAVLLHHNTQNTKLFRPPYGKLKSSQAKKLLKSGYKIIMWDVLSADYNADISKEECVENVIKNTVKGSIIVFHDSVKAKEKLYFTLPKILEILSKKGFIFKAI